MRLQNSVVTPDEQDNKNISPDELDLTQEEEINPEERARRTFEQRPKDPAEEVLADMNEFFITKQSLNVTSEQSCSHAQEQLYHDVIEGENMQHKIHSWEQLKLSQELENQFNVEEDKKKKKKKGIPKKPSKACRIV